MMPREIKNLGSGVGIQGGVEPNVMIFRDVFGDDRIQVGAGLSAENALLTDVETLILAWKLRQKDGR